MRAVVAVLGLTACGFSATGGSVAPDSAPDVDAFVDPIPLDGPRTDWWDASYAFRRPIAIDTAKLAGPLVDFPVLVTLPAGFATASATLDDVRFVAADNATLVDFELDTQLAGGDTTLWVKLALDPATPKTMWLYYGNAAATVRSSGPSVFGAYRSVNHLGEARTDSSGHAHVPTLPASAAQTPGVRTGRVGQSRFFDGDDYLVLADSAAMNMGTKMAATAWIRVSAYQSGYQCVVCKADEAWRMHRGGNGNGIGFGTTSGGSNDLNGDLSVNDTLWHHAAIVMDGQKKHIYIDGVEDKAAGYTKTLDNSTKLVRIGMNETFGGRYWNGEVDELRLVDDLRTPAWIAAEVTTVTDPTFVTLGAPEPY